MEGMAWTSGRWKGQNCRHPEEGREARNTAEKVWALVREETVSNADSWETELNCMRALRGSGGNDGRTLS
jgi:hypothetical protein